MKMMGKRGTSFRGTGSSEAVSTLCDKKVDHETFLESVLLFAKYDNILKCHLENVIKKYLQNKPDKHKHNRENKNTFISKTTVNSIIAILSKLMKEEISNSVREAGIYSVQIDSTPDITSPDQCSVILRFVRKNVEELLLAGNWSRPVQFVEKSFAEAKHRRFQMHLRQYRWSIKHIGEV